MERQPRTSTPGRRHQKESLNIAFLLKILDKTLVVGYTGTSPFSSLGLNVSSANKKADEKLQARIRRPLFYELPLPNCKCGNEAHLVVIMQFSHNGYYMYHITLASCHKQNCTRKALKHVYRLVDAKRAWIRQRLENGLHPSPQQPFSQHLPTPTHRKRPSREKTG